MGMFLKIVPRRRPGNSHGPTVGETQISFPMLAELLGEFTADTRHNLTGGAAI
jgi:hypothetical protein